MRKKRTYTRVINEMLTNLKKSTDSQWAELFFLATNFHQFCEGYVFARGGFPRWEKKFFQKMVETATKPSHWFSVAISAEKNSFPWNNAIEKLLANARQGENILNRWKNLRLLLPKDHCHMKEVRNKISVIKKARKK